MSSVENILVWLPSPMGDAVLCTPALKAIRRQFQSERIFFLANTVVQQVLSPAPFNNEWITLSDGNLLKTAELLRKHGFSQAILFKNSFASAAAAFLAGIPSRVGYARESRGFMLTEKLHQPRLADGRYKPISMIDYYLAVAGWLGADTDDRIPELSVDPQAMITLKTTLGEVIQTGGPIIVLVPGGAFGPSKCWPSERFAKLADSLIGNYNARVFVSVSPAQAEKKIADEICRAAKGKIISLAEKGLSLGELKALFSIADLAICNDTGPRHIAIALGRKVVTLFGPNDPAWTDTGCKNEIQLVADVECAPCQKPHCRKTEHLCMESITVERVYDAAKQQLDSNKQ